ncbi:hypothetical protein [Gordoniibacillus kamchatkensis]|uniref:hypothetical protein n=1 Tax=Gordoniibacillus kamchatkensis TaxID=1590651 RepID=UPI0006973597|nr:hypothetical protein [Paenibacillus sp. VKM B-2647]
MKLAMTKRKIIMLVSIVSAVLLLCGWTAFAATSSGTASSASLTGSFKSLSSDGTHLIATTDKGEQTLTLAKSVWVYRDGHKAQLSDLKPGDRIEVIVNSKNQAAYIKAAAEQPSAPAPQPGTQSPQQTANPQAPAAAVQPAPPATVAPSATAPSATGPAATSPQATKPVAGLDGLELKIDGEHFKLQIQPNHGPGGTRYELNLKPEGGAPVHLKGDEAAAWIKDLLGSVDISAADAQKQLLQAIADRFGVNAGKLHIQMNGAVMQPSVSVPVQPQQAADDDHEDDYDDDHDGGKSADHSNPAIQKPESKQKHGNGHDKKHD